MPQIENYFDLVEDTNPETNKIKGYRAKKEFWIKEIHFEDEKDKISKLSNLEKLKNNITIYEIIEREKVLYISIDYNKKSAKKFNKIMSEANNNGLKKEIIIKGNGKYSKLNEIQNLYNRDYSMCKFELPVNDKIWFGSGFFFEIDSELGIPFKKCLFSCNHVLKENEILRRKNYLEFKYKGNTEEINISNSIIYSKKIQDFSNLNTSNQRKIFTDEELDYTCIELLENDGIFQKLQSVSLFKMSKNYSDENTKNSEIFVLQYPKGEELSFSLGQVSSIYNSLIKHSASTEGGSSGSPIISRQNINNVIGIHFLGETNLNANYAHSMESILNDIKHKYYYKINTLTNNIKSLNNHSSYVNNIIILKDGRLCSCSSDQKIIIYNKNFEIDATIKDNANIYYHSQLSNYDIISCCKDNTLKIYSIYGYNLIYVLRGHNMPVLKMIEVKGKIISSAWDKTIKVWEKDEGDTYICTKTMQICNYDNMRINLIRVNSYKIAVTSSEANLVSFYSIMMILTN